MLVHGWGGSFESTWQRNGFTALLEDGGKQVIGVDLLGHGDAPKPHEPEAYADLTERIVDALPAEPVAAIGFSLGALTLLRTAMRHPERFERLVLAGIGQNVFDRDHSGSAAIADGSSVPHRGRRPGIARSDRPPVRPVRAAARQRPRGAARGHGTPGRFRDRPRTAWPR